MFAPETFSLETAIARHLAWLRAHNYAEATIASRAWTLGLFRTWAEERAAAGIGEGLVRVAVGLEDVADITADLSRGLAGT